MKNLLKDILGGLLVLASFVLVASVDPTRFTVSLVEIVVVCLCSVLSMCLGVTLLVNDLEEIRKNDLF